MMQEHIIHIAVVASKSRDETAKTPYVVLMACYRNSAVCQLSIALCLDNFDHQQ